MCPETGQKPRWEQIVDEFEWLVALEHWAFRWPESYLKFTKGHLSTEGEQLTLVNYGWFE